MDKYKFTSIEKFLTDKNSYQLPKFLSDALRRGSLEVRGTETDKKLYKIYYRSYKGQTTRVLKEIKNGMILIEENGQPVIEGLNSREEPKDKTLSKDFKCPKQRKNTKKKEKVIEPKKQELVKKEAPEKTKRSRKIEKFNKEGETYYRKGGIIIPSLKNLPAKKDNKMAPYKFISIEKFLEDIKSMDPAFEKIRAEYRKLNLRVIGKVLYVVYSGVSTTVDPTDYLVQCENGRLCVLEESEVES